jgi:hypothetical protein
MQNFEKRIAALEQATRPKKEITIIRQFVTPGHLDAEIDHIRDDYGNEWSRRPGEAEKAFTDRATAETTATAYGVKSLIADNLELSHAGH